MMGKKVLLLIVATLMLVLTLGLLVACSNTDTPPVIDGDGTGVSPAPTPTPDQGGNNGGGSQTPVEPDDKASIVSIVNGSVEGLDCYLEVSPSTVNIDLSGSIEVSKDSSWQLYADVLGQQLIPTKYAANLVDGDNIYYVVVNSADGTVNRTYTLHIWRNFYVDVMFVSQGEVVKTLTRTTHTYISNDEFISVSRTGYTHTGWTNHTDGEDYYITGYNSSYSALSSTITFDAKFSANDYTITLDANGGSCGKDSVEVTYDSYFELPVPTRTGYTFDGWEYNGTKITTTSGSCITGFAYDKNITAKAKWSINSYQLTVNSDGNHGSVTSSGSRQYNSSVTITATPNVGYTFAGWYKGGTKVSDNASYTFTMPANDVTYTAIWEINAEMQNFEFTSTTTTCTITGVKDTTLTSIIIPDSVTRIGSYAFDDCTRLTSIVIPDNVTSIGSDAFRGCSSLESLTIPFVGEKAGVTGYNISKYPLGYLFGTSSYTGGVETTQEYYGIYSTTRTTYYIPSSLKSVTVTGGYIPRGAFYNCNNITNITLGDDVTSIGSYAFAYCDSLTSIVIPDNVTTIGEYAFLCCSSLESLTIPFVGAKAGVTGSSTYQYPLGYIFGTSNMTGATTQYYYGSSTSSITSTTYLIPSSLKSVTVTGGNILYGAFYNCNNITNITLGDDVTTIGAGAFNNCTSLTSISVEENNPNYKSIDGNLYSKDGKTLVQYAIGKTATSFVIPDSVTTIGDYAFRNCDSLTSIVIPDSVTTIGYRTFYECSSLTSVTIGDSVTTIGEEAFSGCDKLVEVYNKSSLNIVAGNSDYGYVGYYALNVYTEEGGSKLSTDEDGYIIYTNGADKILVGYTGTETDLIIPDGIKEIYKYAFWDCSSLTSIVIPDSVTTIGNYAFEWCDSLTSVTIGSGVTTIGDYAFYDCDGLTSIVIPDSVTTISSWAFAHCDSLTSVTIGDSVTTIGDYAFYYCDSLKNVYYTGTKEQWEAISIGSSNSRLTNATRRYYSECIYDNNQWRYDADGNISTELTVGEWVVDTERTCTTNGSIHTTCSVCGETVTLEIPALGHSVGDDGVCTVCGEVMYTITNDATYPFVETDGVLQSTNKAHSSSSSYVITAITTITITFEYNVSSESNYDKFYIYHNTTQEVVKSGTSNSYTSYSITLNAGDTLTFKYTKDGSSSSGDDCCYIKNLTITNANN